MSQFHWLLPNTIFLTTHGSHAYGLAQPTSDLDVKGICIPPRPLREHLFQSFEQAENAPEINTSEEVKPRINPLNPKVESTVFTLRKFFKLAADVNPNVIELLFTAPRDHLKTTPLAQELLGIRNLFLSSKAKFTFTGYAAAQLKKIERHRKWLISPVQKKPERADFKLPPEQPPAAEAVMREVKKLVEEWNFHQYALDELQRHELKEACWEVVCRVTGSKIVDWSNWPEHYWAAATDKLQQQLGFSDELRDLIDREHLYQRQLNAYQAYQRWLNERNPERRALEQKYGYDVKHAAHLVRLLRMGREILTTGEVVVNRPDAEDLLKIRRGEKTYDEILAYAAELNTQVDEAYKNTKLPRSVNYVLLNHKYHYLVDRWDAYAS